MKCKLLILEFSPVAEEIWKIKCSSKQGYREWNPNTGVLSFFDVSIHDTKIRPEVSCVYAGGKATNVARILAGLCENFQTNQHNNVALTTFLPEKKNRDINATLATSDFIRSLQAGSLHNVELSYEEIDFENPTGKVRRAVHAIDVETHNDLINFTPQLQWSIKDTVKVIDKINTLEATHWIVLAGTPPKGAEHLYSQVIEKLRERSAQQNISIDTSGTALKNCLKNPATHPQIISINKDEYFGIDKNSWGTFTNPVLVHDKCGCWVLTGNEDQLFDGWQTVPYIDISKLQTKLCVKVGPALGAGDAFHAGVLYGLQFLGFNEIDAAKYGLAVASVAVRSGVGISEINYRKIAEIFPFFDKLEICYRHPEQ